MADKTIPSGIGHCVEKLEVVDAIASTGVGVQKALADATHQAVGNMFGHDSAAAAGASYATAAVSGGVLAAAGVITATAGCGVIGTLAPSSASAEINQGRVGAIE